METMVAILDHVCKAVPSFFTMLAIVAQRAVRTVDHAVDMRP